MTAQESPRRITVVGASAAGLAAAEGLRRLGYDGRLTLVGDEAHPPYDRPPLSKQVLSGEWDTGRLPLRDPAALEALDLQWKSGQPATSLDTRRREVLLADESRVGYDALVVATGARARTLPGSEGVRGVHTLRTWEDAVALREALKSGGGQLVIVGGGFIGAEAAAVARAAGWEVTLVTDTAVPMGDALGDEIGSVVAGLHRDNGVRLETGVLVENLLTAGEGDSARATGVLLADGRTLEADAVLVGIGARPNIEWLDGSGVPLGNGVECAADLRAADGIWAAGDVASWPDPVSGTRLRIEHRTNAGEQGLAVARNILAGPDGATPFSTVPYVWSDQYGLKLQIYGLTRGADMIHVVEGSPDEHRFTALYGRDGRVCAALGVNMVRPLRALRRLVAARTPWHEAVGSPSASV